MSDECLDRARRRRAVPEYDESEKQAIIDYFFNQNMATNRAGIASGRSRAARALVRHYFIRCAYRLIKKAYQCQPYADDSIEALMQAYAGLVGDAVECPPFKVTRDTFIKDMKKIGIRSKLKRK